MRETIRIFSSKVRVFIMLVLPILRNRKLRVGETSRPLEVRIKEHKYNLTQGLLGKSKLAQHAYEKGHKIFWNEAKVFQIETNATYRKYKESVHMSLLDHPISQPSLDISPMWTPVITAEGNRLQRHQVSFE
jgi:hypothetical protein